MMANNTGAWIAGILLAGGAIGAAVYFGRKAMALEPGTPNNNNTGTGGNTGGGNTGGGNTGGGNTYNPQPAALQTNLVLKLGSQGPEVMELQRYINSIHKQPPPFLSVDGKFGPLTENLVKMYNDGYGQTTLASIKTKNILRIF